MESIIFAVNINVAVTQTSTAVKYITVTTTLGRAKRLTYTNVTKTAIYRN